MGCLSTNLFFTGSCGSRMGGVRAIWVALRSAVNDGWFLDESWLIANDGIESNEFIRIAGRGSFQTVAQVNEDTGQVYYRDELNFTPARSENDSTNIRDILARLSASSPDDFIVLVEPWSESPYILGKAAGAVTVTDTTIEEITDAPVFFSGGQIVTGTEHTDANGLSFVLSSVHPYPALRAYVEYNGVANPSTD